ncbi:MAG: DUF2191 domain-containing protein [Gemmatimonadota bacterium]|jgi:hypothetical protein
MRTTVDLDSDLLEELREEAHRRGVPFKHLLNSLLRRGLERGPVDVEPYVCPEFSMGEPRPGIDLDKALRIAGTLEDEEVARRLRLRK